MECKARTGHFFGWIPPLGWVSGWVGGWEFERIYPQGLAPCRLGYGPAPFPHLLSPSLPTLRRFMATRCIYVYFAPSTLSWVHGDAFSVCAAEHPFLPPMSSDLFCNLLWR